MLTALYWTLEREQMQLHLLKEGDWFGMATMAVGLAALQTVLEEGNKDDWFGSPFIFRLTIIAIVFVSLFLWIELSRRKPLVEASAFVPPQLRTWHRGEFLARICAVRFGLHPAAVSGPGAWVQLGANWLGHGLDGIAAARDHSVRSEADGEIRRARDCVDGSLHLCGKQPHEHAYVA